MCFNDSLKLFLLAKYHKYKHKGYGTSVQANSIIVKEKEDDKGKFNMGNQLAKHYLCKKRNYEKSKGIKEWTKKKVIEELDKFMENKACPRESFPTFPFDKWRKEKKEIVAKDLLFYPDGMTEEDKELEIEKFSNSTDS